MSRIKDAWLVLTGKKRLKTIHINAEQISLSDGEAILAVDSPMDVCPGDKLDVGGKFSLIAKSSAVIVTQEGES